MIRRALLLSNRSNLSLTALSGPIGAIVVGTPLGRIPTAIFESLTEIFGIKVGSGDCCSNAVRSVVESTSNLDVEYGGIR